MQDMKLDKFEHFVYIFIFLVSYFFGPLCIIFFLYFHSDIIMHSPYESEGVNTKAELVHGILIMFFECVIKITLVVKE